MKRKKIEKLETVRVCVSVLEMVRKYKEKTRFPIGAFFEIAAIEKLEKEKNKK